jgi:hypothetical protein
VLRVQLHHRLCLFKSLWIVQSSREDDNHPGEQLVCLVNSGSAIPTEVDRQLLAALVGFSVVLSGARNDTELVLWEKKIECVSTATDLAAGQTVARSLDVCVS